MSEKPVFLEDWHVVSYEGPCNDPKSIRNDYDRQKRHGASVCMGVERKGGDPHECLATMTASSEEHAVARAKLVASAPALVRALLPMEFAGEDLAGDRECWYCCASESEGRHNGGCHLDAALTLAGFPDAASRDAARARMSEEQK